MLQPDAHRGGAGPAVGRPHQEAVGRLIRRGAPGGPTVTPPLRPGGDLRRRWVRAAWGLVLGLIAAATLTARALDQSPPPSQAPAAGATEPPPPASTCLAVGGVAIGTGDDAQSVVNGNPPGATYIIKAGVHLRNFSVQPKSGDRFCGEPGAVLDGERSLPTAFSGG